MHATTINMCRTYLKDKILEVVILDQHYVQVKEGLLLGMCYILCTSRKKFLPRETCHIFRWFFDTSFFADGFLFLVKELRLLTNPCHWVRVLDVAGSYMYIVL
jgi:hypothetical protein